MKVTIKRSQKVPSPSPEIGPSTVFGVYQHIKNREKSGIDKKTILDEILEMFGDKNPEVNTLYQYKNKKCPKC